MPCWEPANMPISTRRRWQREHDDLRIFNSFRQAGCKKQAFLLHVSFKNLLKAAFENRDFTLLKAFYLSLVNVDTSNRVTRFCITGARHQSYVSRTDYRYFHLILEKEPKSSAFLATPFCESVTISTTT